VDLMADSGTEDCVIDRAPRENEHDERQKPWTHLEGRVEKLRNLTARKPSRALAKANAQVALAKSLAMREARHSEKHERAEHRQTHHQATKQEERREKARDMEERISRISSVKELRQQAVESKARTDQERHAAKEQKLQESKSIEKSMRSVLAKERDEKVYATRAKVVSMRERQQAVLREKHAYIDQRCEAFKAEMAQIRSEAVEAGKDREVAKADDLARHKDRLDKARVQKEAAWNNKLERVTIKQNAQYLAQQEIKRYNLEMERKIERLTELTEKLALPGGAGNRKLYAELQALQQELQDMSDAVPLPSPGLVSTIDPSLPKYMQIDRRPASAEPTRRATAAQYYGDADKPDDLYSPYSPGNTSTRAPTTAPSSPVRAMPGE